MCGDQTGRSSSARGCLYQHCMLHWHKNAESPGKAEKQKLNVSDKTWNEWGTIWEHGIHF